MRIGQFTPIGMGLRPTLTRFSPAGQNAAFCQSILGKGGGAKALRMEPLIFALPAKEEDGGATAQQSPVVVNLLMQLRAYTDQTNVFLNNRFQMMEQVTRQLHLVMKTAQAQTQAQSAAIERAVTQKLYQEGEFHQAVARLERSLKKNAR